MDSELRNRLRKTKRSEQSIDSKLADFFSNDEKLKKYGKNSTDIDKEENDLVIGLKRFHKKLSSQTKKITTSIWSKRTLSTGLRRNALLGVGSILVIVALVLATGAINKDSKDDTPTVQGTTTEVQPIEPEFVVATINNEYQPTEVAYDAERKVASFGVSLDSETDAIISQQEISAADASRENFLLSVAQSFDINREVQTQKGPLFIGSNQKQRVVTAVYLEGTFLFFIRSNNLVEDDQIIALVEEIKM